MRPSDQLLLGWIAPNGIIAAATAGIFGPGTGGRGLPGCGLAVAGHLCGRHRTFQLAADQVGARALKDLQPQQRGFLAVDSTATIGMSSERLAQGWQVQATKLTKRHGWSAFAEWLGQPGRDWMLLGGFSPSGGFRLCSKEQRFKRDAGWTALPLAPASARLPVVEAVA